MPDRHNVKHSTVLPSPNLVFHCCRIFTPNTKYIQSAIRKHIQFVCILSNLFELVFLSGKLHIKCAVHTIFSMRCCVVRVSFFFIPTHRFACTNTPIIQTNTYFIVTQNVDNAARTHIHSFHDFTHLPILSTIRVGISMQSGKCDKCIIKTCRNELISLIQHCTKILIINHNQPKCGFVKMKYMFIQSSRTARPVSTSLLWNWLFFVKNICVVSSLAYTIHLKPSNKSKMLGHLIRMFLFCFRNPYSVSMRKEKQ